MADTKNVYEQLEELKEKLNEANKPRTLVEQLANNDPAVIEFVKNAKRVWRYCGDKSELKRRNKKKQQRSIIAFFLLAIYLIIPFFFVTLLQTANIHCTRCKKYSSKLDISRSFVCNFAQNIRFDAKVQRFLHRNSVIIEKL